MKTQSIPKAAFNFLAPATVAAPSGDTTAPAERLLTGIAYAGDVISDHWYWSRAAIDLSGVVIDTPLPLLNAHAHDCTIGMVTAANTQRGVIAIEARLFADVDDEAAAIAAKADKGFPWQLSVGIWPDSIEDVQPGATVQLNGKTLQGPLQIFRAARIREISVCALGADGNTSAQVFSAEADFITIPIHEVNPMPEPNPLQAELDAAKANIAALQAENETLRANFAAAQKSQREADIKALFTALGREYSDADAAPYYSFSAEQFAAVAKELKALKPNPPGYLFRAEGHDPDKGRGETGKTIDFNAIYAARSNR
jgi:hypothetical protein